MCEDQTILGCLGSHLPSHEIVENFKLTLNEFYASGLIFSRMENRLIILYAGFVNLRIHCGGFHDFMINS